MFEPKKFNDIAEAMRLKTLESGVLTDYEVGSVTRTLQESFAWEMAALYEKMNLVYLSAFVDTAEGGHLDKVVAILGIKRGEPEFSIGEVVFERDKGDEPIQIPVGTLVGTEETPETPQKVYQTTENAVLDKAQTTVKVYVQALIAGEDQDAPANSVTVMPRPIPGVKSVINNNEILLIGKKRETDEALRRRAKNTLLASGKATTIAIESALLALPGVTDVQVREDFQYAQGRVRLQRKQNPPITGDINIPALAELVLTFGTQTLSYEVMDEATILAGQNEVIVEVRALLEGKAGEFRYAVPGMALNFKDSGLNQKVTLQLNSTIIPGNFGVIRVFVDGTDLVVPDATDLIKQQRYQKAIGRVRTELDRVRAAGIYAVLESARPVWADLALLIALDPTLKPTPEERVALENRAREAVLDHFRQLRMEQPLVYAKLLRALTDTEGVDDLTASQIAVEVIRPGLPSILRPTVVNAFNKIDVNSYERLLIRDLCVASEPKTLTVDFDFSLTPPALPATEEGVYNNLKNTLSTRFNQKAAGDAINLADILAGQPAPAKIRLNAWCIRASLPKSITGTTVFKTLFFEKAALGALFVYYRTADIIGGMRVALAPTLNDKGRSEALTAAKGALDTYLEQMLPETPVLLDEMQALLAQVPGIETATLEVNDFRLSMSDGSAAANRLDTVKRRIQVRKFEKARLLAGSFLLSDGRTSLTLKITALSLRLTQRRNEKNEPITLTTTEIDTAKKIVAVAVNTYFNIAEMGKDIVFNDFKGALEGLSVGVAYAIDALAFEAKSQDGREQSASLTNAVNIHVRSMELPVMTPIAVANIGHTPV